MVTVEGTMTRPEAAGRRPVLTRAVIAAVAVLPPLTQVVYFVAHARRAWPLIFADDAFYYFGVARHIGTGQGSTFAGLIQTNGYHPLWMAVLSAVAFVVRDAYAFLAAVVVVESLLWLGVVRQGLAIGRLLGSEAAALAGLAALGTLAVLTGQLSFSGMESAPLLFLLLLAVRMVLQLDDGDDTRGELRVGLVLALVCLARLDATLTAVPLALVAARRDGPALVASVRRGVRLVGPLLVALAVYVALNLAVFDTPTPVSGQAKSLGGPFFDLRPVGQALRAGQVGQRPLWIGAITLVMLAVAFALPAWRTMPTSRRLMACAGAVLVGQALLLAYLVVASSYPVWAWYHYNIAVLAFCATTLVAVAVGRRPGAARATTGACLAVALVFSVVQMPVTLLSHLNHEPQEIETARFINLVLPERTVLAMGDRAGLVGYLANRPMIQVEGLMADARWLDDLEHGTAHQRMVEEGVTTYVWAGVLPPPMLLRDGRVCRRMTEPRNSVGPHFSVVVCDQDLQFRAGDGDDQFTVWSYRPELNP
jgi:hypothetical protein